MGLLGGVQNSMNNPLNTNGMPAWGGYNPSALQGVNPNTQGGLPGMGQAPGQSNFQNLDYSNLGRFGSVDMSGQEKLDSGFGAVQGVRDAMMSRLSPQLQQAREQEAARLKSQGIPENSDIFQKSMEAKDRQFNDANQQALLGGAQEYGNIFNRGLASNNQKFSQQMGLAGLSDSQRAQQAQEANAQNSVYNTNQSNTFNQGMNRANFQNSSNQQQFGQNQAQQQLAMSLRGQQFGEQGSMADMNMKQRNAMLGEQQALRQQPLNDLKGLLAGNPSSPAFAQFNTAGQAQAPDLVGAASAQYQAQLAQQNANNASSSNTTNGLIGLGGSFLGSQAGNNLMNWGGNKFGDWLGGLWKP